MAGNTGYKAWSNLQQYNVANGVATGVTKPNVSSDPDYVAPVYDESACPTGPDTNAPAFSYDWGDSTYGNFRVIGANNTSIQLAWDAASDNVGVTGYEVYRRLGTSGSFTKIATLSGATLTYISGGLSQGTQYGYYITALDAAGNSGIFSSTHTEHAYTTGTAQGTLTVSPTYLYYASGGGTQTVTVTSSVSWTTTQSSHSLSQTSGNAGTTYVDITKFGNGGSTTLFGSVNFNITGLTRTVSTEQAPSSGGGGGEMELQ